MYHYFDQAREELEIEWNSRYDYMHEAFGAEADALRRMAILDAKHEAEKQAVEAQDAMEARGGPLFRMTYPDDEIPF